MLLQHSLAVLRAGGRGIQANCSSEESTYHQAGQTCSHVEALHHCTALQVEQQAGQLLGLAACSSSGVTSAPTARLVWICNLSDAPSCLERAADSSGSTMLCSLSSRDCRKEHSVCCCACLTSQMELDSSVQLSPHRETLGHALQARHVADHCYAAAHGAQGSSYAVHVPAGKEAVYAGPQVTELCGVLQPTFVGELPLGRAAAPSREACVP